MKKLVYLVLTILLFTSYSADAQKLTKAEKRAIKEQRMKEQAAEDAENHKKAIFYLDHDQWAFQADGLYDQNGVRMNVPTNQPNFAGFGGVNFCALLISNSPFGPIPIVIDSPGKFVEKKIDKKGNLVYKFSSMAPTRSETTLTLYKDTDAATITISPDRGSYTYPGKVMNIRDCWYFLTGDGRKKTDSVVPVR